MDNQRPIPERVQARIDRTQASRIQAFLALTLADALEKAKGQAIVPGAHIDLPDVVLKEVRVDLLGTQAIHIDTDQGEFVVVVKASPKEDDPTVVTFAKTIKWTQHLNTYTGMAGDKHVATIQPHALAKGQYTLWLTFGPNHAKDIYDLASDNVDELRVFAVQSWLIHVGRMQEETQP